MAANGSYDRESEIKAFDNSKAGVKGLVDAGLTKVPQFFIHEKSINEEKSSSTDLISSQVNKIPVIDLAGADRTDIIEKIRVACEKWGFFQIINHGIPVSVLDKMIEGVRSFHELEVELKKNYYTRDFSKKFSYISNLLLYNGDPANWSDSISWVMAPSPADPHQLPSVCRDIITEYSNYIMRLGLTMLELLSETLGLKPSHLKDMGCKEGLFFLGHYYPPCPEPELTIGTFNHTDSGFFTILLQDLLGGLQVRHEENWVDVTPQPGALIVNVADLLQLLTNDKFKSVHHRVVVQKIGPRVSVAAFFMPLFAENSKTRLYGPIKELISEENPQIYREITLQEYHTSRSNGGRKDEPAMLAPFKIPSV